MKKIDKLINDNVFCRVPHILLDSLENSQSWLDDITIYDDDDEPIEILEYWLVSDSLGIDLSIKGEAVHQLDTCFIWGRKSTSLALEFDPILNQIASSK
jgi:hypothetical protein